MIVISDVPDVALELSKLSPNPKRRVTVEHDLVILEGHMKGMNSVQILDALCHYFQEEGGYGYGFIDNRWKKHILPALEEVVSQPSRYEGLNYRQILEKYNYK